ncbi:FA53A protein, partial [Polypterus senegalus]|nr:FA53A protein [Polypterus senegalus]
MLVGLSSKRVTTTMVTLITEKLQNQSLDDLACKAYSINLHSPESLNQSDTLFPFEIHEDRPWRVVGNGCQIRKEATSTKATAFHFPICQYNYGGTDNIGLQWQKDTTTPSSIVSWVSTSGSTGNSTTRTCSSVSVLPGWISELNLNENCSQPLAPPTKRHCRSLSEPDELARCRSPWKPNSSSKVWTPVSKRRCNSGGSTTLQRCNSQGSATMQRSTSVCLPQPTSCSLSNCSKSGSKHILSLNNSVINSNSFNTSPVPRPSSASSGFVDSSEGSTNSSGIRWHSGGPCDYHPRRRLSLSQEHITDTATLLPSANSTPTSTPELSRRQGLLRCRSQPCVLNERKSGLKRRREEDVRWSRPSLDFLKMTRTLKNSKSLCSLDYEEDDDIDDPHMKTIVSSPCDSNDLLMNIITPGSSPMKESVTHHHNCHSTTGHVRSFGSAATVSESEEDTSDCDSTDDGIFPLDCGDLDLEQIENN